MQKSILSWVIIYIKNKNLNRAEKELCRAIALRPQDWRYVLVLAYVLHTRAKYAEAVDSYQQTIKLIPSNEKAHLEGAYLNSGMVLHEEINCFDEAEKHTVTQWRLIRMSLSASSNLAGFCLIFFIVIQKQKFNF